jgi:putative transposase
MANDSMITPELLDQLLVNYSRPEDLLGEEGLFKLLKKALIERALGAELTEHLGYEKGDPAGRGSGNNRDGVGSKTVLTGAGAADEDRRAAGSRRELRASIDPQGADPVRGL